VRLVVASEGPVTELLGRCRFLDQLRTRLVLQAASEEDSVALLGVPVAEHLSAGGHAFLRLEGRLSVQGWARRVSADRLGHLKHLHQQPVARAIAVLYGLYLAYYLAWRATATLDPDALGFSLLLLLVESTSLVSFALFALMTWDTQRPARYTVQPYTEQGNVWPFSVPGVPESTHAFQ
jgi:hypothetical protein